MMTAVTPVSKIGLRRLADAEAKIERGLETFAEVGAALLEIRNERLYRDNHETFEAYLRQRWDLSKSRAYQLIDAAEVSTIVDVANEAQARALAPLKSNPIEVQEVYEEAEKRGDTTAAGLSRVVAERKNPTQGADDDAVGGKGSPSGAPATAATSTGKPAAESVPAAPEGTEPEVSALGAQPPAPLPPVDPALKMHAALSAARADVAKWLAFDRHDEVVAAMSTEQRADYRSFLISVQTHVSDALHLIDDVPRLKAVR